MSNIENKLKTIYDKLPHSKTFDRDKTSEINIARVNAAHKGNAIQYKIYCDALGIEPEEQFSELYTKGIEEYTHNHNSKKIVDLEYHIQKALYGNTKFKPEKELNVKPLEKYQIQFLKMVEQYNFSMNVNDQIDEKKKLLQKYHTRYGPRGKNNLNKSNYENEGKMNIGKVFKNTVENYRQRLQYHDRLEQQNNY